MWARAAQPATHLAVNFLALRICRRARRQLFARFSTHAYCRTDQLCVISRADCRVSTRIAAALATVTGAFTVASATTAATVSSTTTIIAFGTATFIASATSITTWRRSYAERKRTIKARSHENEANGQRCTRAIRILPRSQQQLDGTHREPISQEHVCCRPVLQCICCTHSYMRAHSLGFLCGCPHGKTRHVGWTCQSCRS